MSTGHRHGGPAWLRHTAMSTRKFTNLLTGTFYGIFEDVVIREDLFCCLVSVKPHMLAAMLFIIHIHLTSCKYKGALSGMRRSSLVSGLPVKNVWPCWARGGSYVLSLLCHAWHCSRGSTWMLNLPNVHFSGFWLGLLLLRSQSNWYVCGYIWAVFTVQDKKMAFLWND